MGGLLMRKLSLLLVLLLVVAFTTSGFAQKYAILKPTNPGVKSEAIPIDKKTYEKLKKNEITAQDLRIWESTHMGVVDTINYVSSAGGVNWGTGMGDTNSVYYDPPAACYIKSIGIVTQTWGNTLPSGFNLIINKPAHAWDFPLELWDGDACYTRDSLGYNTLLGEEMWGLGGFPATSIEGERIWTDMMYLGVEPDNQGEPFVVSIIPYGGDPAENLGTDAGYVDEGSAGDNPARLAKFYQAGRGGYDPQFVVRHYCCTWLVVVEYYENTGPKIEGVPQLPSTYYSSEPMELSATITDIDASNPANAGVKDAYLVWMANGKTDSVQMVASGNVYTATLPAVSSIGEVSYWVSATDNGSPPLRSTSTKLTFEILEPKNPNADLLLVLQGPHNPDFYRNALSNLGFLYEEWNADANYGIDASITGFGWSTIIVAGWGCSTVPTRDYAGNPYAAFLNGGGNMFLGDMDYFWINGEPEAVDTTFAAGDFTYDFFGLASGVSDPGAHLDSVITGVAGDPISDDWATTPLALDWYRYAVYTDYNWIDYVTAGNATKIFTAESGNDVGVRMEGSTFKTVFLSFMLDAVGDSVASPDVEKLLGKVLTWFGTSNSVESDGDGIVPVKFSLEQNYPNPFNPETMITYSISKPLHVTLSVYNVVGQKVAELVNEFQSASSYHVTFDAKDLSSGVYFYRLEAGDYIKTLKMMLVR